MILRRKPDGTITEEFTSGSNAGTNFTSRFLAEGSEAANVEVAVDCLSTDSGGWAHRSFVSLSGGSLAEPSTKIGVVSRR